MGKINYQPQSFLRNKIALYRAFEKNLEKLLNSPLGKGQKNHKKQPLRKSLYLRFAKDGLGGDFLENVSSLNPSATLKQLNALLPEYHQMQDQLLRFKYETMHGEVWEELSEEHEFRDPTLTAAEAELQEATEEFLNFLKKDITSE